MNSQDRVQIGATVVRRRVSPRVVPQPGGRLIRGARVSIITTRTPSRLPCSVYAIGAERLFIKFGYASNAARRMNHLQSGSPLDLELLASIVVPDQWAAMQLERYLHIAASDFRVRGEWFHSSPRTLMFVEWMRLPFAKFEELIRAASRDIEQRLEGRMPNPVKTRNMGGKS